MTRGGRVREDRLIVGYESALDFWRATRAAYGGHAVPDLDGRVFGARQLTSAEQAALATSLCASEGLLDVVLRSRKGRHGLPSVVDHVWRAPLTDEHLLGIGTNIFVCKMPVVLCQLASSWDVFDVAEVACEMSGTYGVTPWSGSGFEGNMEPLVDLAELRGYASAARALRVRGAARALSALDQSVSGSTRALTISKQKLCVEMSKKVRSDCDSLIEERAAISEEYAKLLEEIKADEDRGRRLKRDAVAETLSRLIHSVFGNKYTFDPELFTVQLDNKVLGTDAEGVMSDGEKSVLAFCHYIASTWSLLDLEEDSAKLFFVIDDPISSLDYHYVYSVAQIIKELGSTFSLSPVRLLLMTHNTAFFNLLARNNIVGKCFTLHSGVIESCKSSYLAPYSEHLKDLYKVARGESQPTHTTGNSIRQVIETLWRFDYPAATSLGNYLETPGCSDLCNCEYVYTMCQDLSHGATPFDREQPPDDEAVKRACVTVLNHIYERYPGQLIALGIDYDLDS